MMLIYHQPLTDVLGVSILSSNFKIFKFILLTLLCFLFYVTGRMRLEVVGGQNKGAANDVTLAVWYKYTGSVWSLIPGATATFPADTTQTTSIEFQPPLQNTVTELQLRIELSSKYEGTSFILREAKLYAVNECGEATYNQFKVHSEEEFYKVEVETPAVDFDLSQNFVGYGKDRMVSDTWHRSFILNGFNFSTKDRDHDTHVSASCAQVYGGGGWWQSACHAGHLTGSYPLPDKTSLPSPHASGIGIYTIVGYYSSLQSLEMMIKPDTPYNSQGEGPIATVATCADLAAVSADCARRCIDRPMVHGGQHSMGTCGRLVLAVLSRCDRLRPHSLTINLLFSFFPHFSNIQNINFLSQVFGAPQAQHPYRTTCGGCHHTGTTNKAAARKSTLG